MKHVKLKEVSGIWYVQTDYLKYLDFLPKKLLAQSRLSSA